MGFNEAAHEQHFHRVDFRSNDRNRYSRRLVFTRWPRMKTNTAKCRIKTITKTALSAVTCLIGSLFSNLNFK